MKIRTALTIAILAATSLFGQPWPVPSRAANTPVICSQPTCADPKLTAPWAPPLQFVGRYFDNNGQHQLQEPLRDLRAMYMRAEPNGIYAQLGSVIVAYDPGTFFSRLAAGEPMIPVTSLQFVNNRGAFPETLLRPRNFWNPKTDQVWSFNSTQADGDIRIFRFDVDDRGYLYPFTDAYGWGILDSQLQTLSHEAQIDARGGGAWLRSGSSYYHFVSPQIGNSRIYDVTDPRNPRFIGPASYLVSSSAHAANGDAAIVDSVGNLHIYTASDSPTGPGRVERPSGKESFYSVASDGASFFASETEPKGETEIAVLSAPNYTRSDVGIGSTFTGPTSIISGGGYVALSGNEQATENGVFWEASNLRLFKLGPGNALVSVPLPTGAAMGAKVTHFLVNYYHGPTAGSTAGYTGPLFSGFGLGSMSDCALIPSGGQVNLVMTTGALGDVWAIGMATQPPICPPLVKPADIPNCTWTLDTSGTCPVYKLTGCVVQPPSGTLDLTQVNATLAAVVVAQQQATSSLMALQVAIAALGGTVLPPVCPPLGTPPPGQSCVQGVTAGCPAWICTPIQPPTCQPIGAMPLGQMCTQGVVAGCPAWVNCTTVIQPPQPTSGCPLSLIGTACERSTPLPQECACQGGKVVKL